jgi:rRNA maturation RNase YbeY
VSKIELFYEDTQTLKLKKSPVKKYINLLINRELKRVGEISIVLCSDKYLLEINIEYLKHNYYTDIITFNYVEGNLISGDLFISVDRVKENSIVFNTGLIKELYRVIFHGILHLIGYNDKTEEEKKIMKTKEDLYLDEVDFSEIEI